MLKYMSLRNALPQQGLTSVSSETSVAKHPPFVLFFALLSGVAGDVVQRFVSFVCFFASLSGIAGDVCFVVQSAAYNERARAYIKKTLDLDSKG